MKRRSFGFVAGNGSQAAPPPDASTSEGLIAISREKGVYAAFTASYEVARKTGKKQVVTLVEGNGEPYVRLASDEPKDPRTMKQQIADARFKADHGFSIASVWKYVAAVVGEERTESVVLALGEDTLRTVWALPKADRRAALEELVKEIES